MRSHGLSEAWPEKIDENLARYLVVDFTQVLTQPSKS